MLLSSLECLEGEVGFGVFLAGDCRDLPTAGMALHEDFHGVVAPDVGHWEDVAVGLGREFAGECLTRDAYPRLGK